MDNLFKSKKTIVIILALIIIAIFSFQFLFAAKKDNKEVEKKEPVEEEIIPTVDDSVEVDLTKERGANEVVLSVNNFPKGTEKIEYELLYETAEQGTQGVIGSIEVTSTKNNSYEKNITLGTCSSGRCVYHKVVGSIKMLLRFNGEYGQKIFEKEYAL